VIEENPSKQSKEGSEQSSDSVAGSTQPSAIDSTGGNPAIKNPPGEPAKPRKILVEIERDNEFNAFETESLELSRNTLKLGNNQARFTVWAIVVAAIAATLVLVQIQVASHSNQILATQTESAIAGASQSDVVTRAQLKIAQQQVKALQDQVDAIKLQMRQDQRPWIEVRDNGGPKVDATEASWSLRFANVGKTPARNFKSVFWLTKATNGATLNLDAWRAYKSGISPVPFNMAFTGVIFPNHAIDSLAHKVGEKKKGVAINIPFSTSDIEELKAGNAYVLVYGELKYWDTFGVLHWTKFCMWHGIIEGNFTAAQCTEYNDVDKN
jgi:hypothetical protein